MADWTYKGAHSELLACAWLLRQGYDVFRNVSPNGMMDIIAIKGDEQLKIDVKTVRPATHYSLLTAHQRAAGVVMLVVKENGECGFWKPPPPTPKRICDGCGRSFQPVRSNQCFHSSRCRKDARERLAKRKPTWLCDHRRKAGTS